MYQGVKKRLFSTKVLRKIEDSTIAHILKTRLQANPHKDVVRFDRHNLVWTVDQLNRYSNAFAYGLLQSGFIPGDKLLLWTSQTHSAQIATAIFGASRINVSLVTFQSNDENDQSHLLKALEQTQARGILISPYTQTSNKDKKRIDTLYDVAPELRSLHPGQSLNLTNLPHLKKIIQTSFNTLRGTIKFNQHMLYAKPSLTTLRMPGNVQNQNLVLQAYMNGESKANYSNQEIVEKADRLWKQSSEPLNRRQVVSAEINSPGGFVAGILAPLLRSYYSFFPQSLNLSEVYKAMEQQASETLVCEKQLTQVEPPQKSEQLYVRRASGLTDLITLINDSTSLNPKLSVALDNVPGKTAYDAWKCERI